MTQPNRSTFRAAVTENPRPAKEKEAKRSLSRLAKHMGELPGRIAPEIGS